MSTDNYGGFASVRTRNLDPLLDLGAYEGMELRLLGDGQRYKFIIRPDSNWDGVAYCQSFDTQPGVWQVRAARARRPSACSVTSLRRRPVVCVPRSRLLARRHPRRARAVPS